MDFDDIAKGYEAWYSTPEGQRADRLEKVLLARLLDTLPRIHLALEVGCGTGHFTRWLATEGMRVVGLDISPAMLAQAQRLTITDDCSYLLGDALVLPFPDRSFDLVALITTLEFIPQPEWALAEAARVARRGLLLGVLNRHSLLALKRRWRSLWTSTIYDRAHFFTVGELGRLARRALGARLRALTWRTTLFLGPWSTALPWGGFIGMVLQLEEEDG